MKRYTNLDSFGLVISGRKGSGKTTFLATKATQIFENYIVIDFFGEYSNFKEVNQDRILCIELSHDCLNEDIAIKLGLLLVKYPNAVIFFDNAPLFQIEQIAAFFRDSGVKRYILSREQLIKKVEYRTLHDYQFYTNHSFLIDDIKDISVSLSSHCATNIVKNFVTNRKFSEN